jgi:broad specificity phosphatase PhoE
MRIYIIRHAEPDNPNHTITEAGHKEAQALAERLNTIKIDRMYTSPLGRALHTMAYTSKLNGLQAEVLDWVQEIDNSRLIVEPWGRMTGWDIPGEILRGKVELPDHNNWKHDDLLIAAKAEYHLTRVQSHSDSFLRQLGYERVGNKYKILKSNSEQIALFCHNGFGLIWLSHLLQIPLPLMWSGFTMAPSSVTTILFDERSSEWAVPRCIGFGDTSHLYHAGLPISIHGIKANVY